MLLFWQANRSRPWQPRKYLPSDSVPSSVFPQWSQTLPYAGFGLSHGTLQVLVLQSTVQLSLNKKLALWPVGTCTCTWHLLQEHVHCIPTTLFRIAFWYHSCICLPHSCCAISQQFTICPSNKPTCMKSALLIGRVGNYQMMSVVAVCSGQAWPWLGHLGHDSAITAPAHTSYITWFAMLTL